MIAPEPFFTPRGTPLSVYYRALAQTRLGLEIDLLTYGQGEDVEVPGLRILRIPHPPWLGEVRAGPSLVKGLLDLLLVLWTLGLLLRRRYDLVHAHEEAVFFCFPLKPIFRFKLVYDMHSSLPEQLRNFEYSSWRPLVAVFRWLELRALRSADAVITICPALAEAVASLGIEPDKHFLIENSLIEPVRLKRAEERGGGLPAEIAALREGGPADAPLLVYAGTLEPYQGIDVLLHAFRKLRERVPEARLLVVGGTTAQRAHYEGVARSLAVSEQCRFTGRLSQASAAACCRLATVQISPRSSGSNTPLKVYQQLASGVPIVATRIPSHTQVLNDEVAFLCEPNPDALADSIGTALASPASRARKAARARLLHEERYSQHQYMTKIADLLKRLS